MQDRQQFLYRRALLLSPALLLAAACGARSEKTSPTPNSQVLNPEEYNVQGKKSKKGKDNLEGPENKVGGTWKIQGVDTMKLSKDRLCDQPSKEYIEKYAIRMRDLGATHLSIDVPLTDVTNQDAENIIYCDGKEVDAFSYLVTWINASRTADLNVIVRSPLMRYEGIYPNDRKIPTIDYSELIRNYYQKLAPHLKKGDVLLSAVEPGGYGIGDGQVFATNEQYNEWLINTRNIVVDALGEKAQELELGCCGFNGFELIGYDNPEWEEKVLKGEWQPIVNKTVIQKFGNKIWIDHYPPIGKTMADFLNKLGIVYPDAEIYIGEYGNTNGMTPDELRGVLQEIADNPQVKGVTYWHGGPGGNEALFTEDLRETGNASFLREFYTTDKSTS